MMKRFTAEIDGGTFEFRHLLPNDLGPNDMPLDVLGPSHLAHSWFKITRLDQDGDKARYMNFTPRYRSRLQFVDTFSEMLRGGAI